jgi:hypothetical protein
MLDGLSVGKQVVAPLGKMFAQQTGRMIPVAGLLRIDQLASDLGGFVRRGIRNLWYKPEAIRLCINALRQIIRRHLQVWD